MNVRRPILRKRIPPTRRVLMLNIDGLQHAGRCETFAQGGGPGQVSAQFGFKAFAVSGAG